MDHVRLCSRFVLVVSDDKDVRHELQQCATGFGVPIFTANECPPPVVLTGRPGLWAAVVDVTSERGAESAWEVIELLRRNEGTERTPVILRYDRRYEITSSLAMSFEAVEGV